MSSSRCPVFPGERWSAASTSATGGPNFSTTSYRSLPPTTRSVSRATCPGRTAKWRESRRTPAYSVNVSRTCCSQRRSPHSQTNSSTSEPSEIWRRPYSSRSLISRNRASFVAIRVDRDVPIGSGTLLMYSRSLVRPDCEQRDVVAGLIRLELQCVAQDIVDDLLRGGPHAASHRGSQLALTEFCFVLTHLGHTIGVHQHQLARPERDRCLLVPRVGEGAYKRPAAGLERFNPTVGSENERSRMPAIGKLAVEAVLAWTEASV